MAFAYTRLTEITTIAAAAAALTTNAAGKTTYIRLIILFNGETTAENVILYNVPDNAAAVGTAGETNEFFNQSMAANETRILEFARPGIMMTGTNDTIQGTTDTASKVTYQAYGGLE
jgi:hypothetical protein